MFFTHKNTLGIINMCKNTLSIINMWIAENISANTAITCRKDGDI